MAHHKKENPGITPPSDLAAEQSVLGAILLKPAVLDEVADLLEAGDFYREANRRIFRTMMELYQRNEPVDLVTVSTLLRDRGQLEEAGGLLFLTDLSESVGIAANAPFYARSVKDKAKLRRLLAASQEITAACLAPGVQSSDLHLLLESQLQKIGSRNGQRGQIPTITAKQLGDKIFKPRRWAVPELVTEGLTILAGKPKAGKSWLALGLGVAVATGGIALGRIQVEAGEVFYLALEDGERRLRERLDKIIPRGEFPDNLHIVTAGNFPPLYNGGIKALEAWLKEHPQARLVVIDTLGRIKPARGRNQDSYDHDTAIIGALQKLSIDHEVAFLLIHHVKKQVEDDFVSEISGTFGLTGAADCIAVLARKARGDMDGILKLTGRDIEEQNLALKFDPALGLWELLGDAKLFDLSQERQDILLILGEVGPRTPAQLSKLLNKKPESIRKLLWSMKKSGEIEERDGKYFGNGSNPGNTGNGGNAGNGNG